MGSSCYSRGNNRNLEVIRDFVAERGLDGEISMRGGLCHGKCKQGPNMTIDGVNYTRVDPNVCVDLLNRHSVKADAL